MQKNNILIAAGVVIIAGVSFFGGIQYDKSQTPVRGNFSGQTAGAFAGRSGMGGAGRASGGFVSGKVLSVGSGSLTIQLQNGNSQIILLGSTAQVLKTTSGSISDLAQGTNVVITGTPNSDGSLTAESVQIRPALPATKQ